MQLEQNQLAQIEQSVSIEQIQLSEKLGAIKATNFIKKLVTVTEIKLIAEIKETKQYKGLKVIDTTGKLVTVSTFEEFCQYLGKSREHVDEDIRNLGVFGEDFLETSQRIGLGYRDLRKLRKLDEADRAVIINGESVKAEDRESLIDLIEEMSAKHSKDKEQLNKQVEELTADIAAKDQVLKSKNEKLDKMDHELTKLKSPPEIKKREESEPQLRSQKIIEELNTACLTIHNDIVRFTNHINSLLDEISEHGLYDMQERVEANVVAAFQQIAQISVDLGIQIDFEAMVNPEWMANTANALQENQAFDATEVEQ
ncbi:hypothetical protein I9054_012315 [Acinetobacter bereziniae]|uniref:Uncharacterized protein n=1 Tax=Acinetobacter bereziniae TaxID=106648 RepID=A0A8I1DHQ3_ACIBZ|nr:hypothetical protein [Acinetobacter bereziniae]QQC83018.1 hypothetical protein I9190_11895 [Acinetobacter bereziniae]UUN96168.1 hypothetical protein I9054_012315 [Acinetobacter bereziniae]